MKKSLKNNSEIQRSVTFSEDKERDDSYLEIYDMPKVVLEEEQILELKKGNKKCDICWSEYEVGQIMKTMPCFHIFHEDCLNKWLEMSLVCPVCKCGIIKEGDT